MSRPTASPPRILSEVPPSIQTGGVFRYRRSVSRKLCGASWLAKIEHVIRVSKITPGMTGHLRMKCHPANAIRTGQRDVSAMPENLLSIVRSN